ncbi:MAG: RloB domain-containing protein [Blastochloris sp.]|nr:RloB domain-containing protein [Blastochloris sp.]
MSLIGHLKPRPLARGEGTLRDDRLFLVACDDTYAPKQYFSFLKLSRVQIHVVVTDDSKSAAVYVLERLRSFQHEPDDERWMLLDTDHCISPSHFPSFIQAIQDARREGIKVALSKPCFELWLLLHHVEEARVKALSNAAKTEAALRKQLGEYNKCRLKMEHFPWEKMAAAVARAKSLDSQVAGGDRPEGNTTRVYQLMEAIFDGIPAQQVPSEFRCLRAL